MKEAKVKRLIAEAFKERDSLLRAQHVEILLKSLQDHGVRVDIDEPYEFERGDDESTEI